VSTARLEVRRPRVRGSAQTWLVGGAALLAALLAAHTNATSSHALIKHALPFLLVPVVMVLFLSERYERTLAVLALYLGLLDGVVKLTSGSNIATLGRDALLYAIVLGALARVALRRTTIEFPPLSGLVLAWIAVCVMQVANPEGTSLAHSVASLRQHLEFVPLFFFGYYILRSQRVLSNFLLLLLLVAAANGIVGLIQSALTPEQLASWGPGYAKLELGSGTSVARVFYTASGVIHPRPPGLGGTDGFGGVLCLIAIPGALALLGNMRRAVKLSWLLVPCTVLAVVGIVTSQERVVIVGSIVAFCVFLALTFTSRRRVGILVVTVVVGVVAYFIASTFTASSANRYSSITASNIVNARSNSLALLPDYLAKYPLGAGLGTVGPASGFAVGGQPKKGLDGETEFNFLIVETGIPGLLVMLAFTMAVIRVGLVLRRVRDPELQRSLMALTAVFIALLVIWFDSPVTADSPTSPFIWLSAGCLVYWYQELRAGRVRVTPRTLLNTLARL
jgi:hypothetical protein